MAKPLLTSQWLRPYAELLTVGWIAYWLVTVGLLHWPKLPAPPSIPHSDKVAHFVTYCLLAVGWVLVILARRGSLKLGWLLVSLVGFAAYAAADELTQPWTNRCCSFDDWTADILGISCAFVVMIIVFGRNKPSSPESAESR